MKKAIVALKFYKLTIPQKVEMGRSVVFEMTDHVSTFPSPLPSLTIISNACDELEAAAITAKGSGKDATAAMYVKEIQLDNLMKALGNYVESIANSDPANAKVIALSSGFGLKKDRSPQTHGFRLQHGKLPGQIMVRTDHAPRSIFTWEMTTTPADENSWEIIGSGTKASFLATDLTRATRYYFRVSKTDREGQGPWSNVLDMVAV